MRPVAGWFLLAFGGSAAAVTAFGAWVTWGADSESFGFGSYTLPLAWMTVLAVAVQAAGARLLDPPRSGAHWAIGAFVALLAVDLFLRASGVLVLGDLDGIQWNEGDGTRVPIVVLSIAAGLAFASAVRCRLLRRAAISPG